MRRKFIKFVKTFTYDEITEHVNCKGDTRFTKCKFKIMKESILEVWADKNGGVWIDSPGCASKDLSERIYVSSKYWTNFI